MARYPLTPAAPTMWLQWPGNVVARSSRSTRSGGRSHHFRDFGFWILDWRLPSSPFTVRRSSFIVRRLLKEERSYGQALVSQERGITRTTVRSIGAGGGRLGLVHPCPEHTGQRPGRRCPGAPAQP